MGGFYFFDNWRKKCGERLVRATLMRGLVAKQPIAVVFLAIIVFHLSKFRNYDWPQPRRTIYAT